MSKEQQITLNTILRIHLDSFTMRYLVHYRSFFCNPIFKEHDT